MNPISHKEAANQPPPYVFGLIGFPLGHSLSPQIHAGALHAVGLTGEYYLYSIPPLPDGAGEMSTLITNFREGKIHGLNVTIPHKATVIPFVDELTPTAKMIGAVNTIYQKGGKLIGDNTDAPGFWTDLNAYIDLNRSINQNVLILGAGGSARAVTYAFILRGYQVTIAARRLPQAEELCDNFPTYRDQLSVTSLDSASLGENMWCLIINTTPVGMHPNPNASPWPIGTPFPEGSAVYDLVYKPSVTKLVKDAREAGLTAVNGLGMLIEQAILAFERWTGLKAPRAAMLKSVRF